jgi:peptidyl-tRNA hydrolase, PTH1 family
MTNRLLLIVGLGNPGKSYEYTRHNLGSMWVKQLCLDYNVQVVSNYKLSADVGIVTHHTMHNSKLICVLLHEWMNNSGIGVKKVISHYKIDPQWTLIIHDDLDLPVGDIRFKKSGGHGGHNGIRSIIEQLNTNEFNRLRIGIGHPQVKEQVANYVLSKANQEEQSIIHSAIKSSMKIVPELFETNINWQKIEQLLSVRKL